jgi:hypothetical protein
VPKVDTLSAGGLYTRRERCDRFLRTPSLIGSLPPYGGGLGWRVGASETIGEGTRTKNCSSVTASLAVPAVPLP